MKIFRSNPKGDSPLGIDLRIFFMPNPKSNLPLGFRLKTGWVVMNPLLVQNSVFSNITVVYSPPRGKTIRDHTIWTKSSQFEPRIPEKGPRELDEEVEVRLSHGSRKRC